MEQIKEVIDLLKATPFKPFVIVTTGGNRYTIPGPRDVNISPRKNALLIWFEDGGALRVVGKNIAAIERDAPKSQAA